MDTSEFWTIIEAAGSAAGPDRPYAASEAFKRITGDGEDFYEARDEYRASRDSSEQDFEDMGEDFDFDDPDEMRRRLPRLAALYLRDTP